MPPTIQCISGLGDVASIASKEAHSVTMLLSFLESRLTAKCHGNSHVRVLILVLGTREKLLKLRILTEAIHCEWSGRLWCSQLDRPLPSLSTTSPAVIP